MLFKIAGKGQYIDAGLRADILRGCLQVGCIAAANHQCRPLFSKHFGTGAPQAFARTTHNANLVLQFQIHVQHSPRLDLPHMLTQKQQNIAIAHAITRPQKMQV